MEATQHEKLSKSRFEEKLNELTSNLTKDKFYERLGLVKAGSTYVEV